MFHPLFHQTPLSSSGGSLFPPKGVCALHVYTREAIREKFDMRRDLCDFPLPPPDTHRERPTHMGRPLKNRPTIHPARPAEASEAQKRAVEALNPASTARRIAEAEKAASEARSAGKRPSPSRYSVDKLSSDPLKAIIFDQLAPDTVLSKIRDDGHLTISSRTVSDTPLDYLMFRVEVSKRIDLKQYQAAKKFLIDNTALGTMGSNTNAIITHLTSGPTERALKEHKLNRLASEARGTDYLEMRAGIETVPVKDISDKMLAAAGRLRRITDKLEQWETSVLTDLVVHERTIGMISQRWGVSSESMSLVVRLALWKLARVYEEVDHEFAAWLSIERQLSGEARS